jgi:nitrite reductase (NADH) small subunit
VGDHLVARLDDLAADRGFVVEIGGRRIGLFRIGDDVFGLHGVCPHQGGPVGSGGIFPNVCGTVENERLREWHDGENAVVACPWHGWEFDIRTGRCLGDPTRGLLTYEVDVRGGDVFVVLPDRPPVAASS